jgi:hypothetical protein
MTMDDGQNDPARGAFRRKVEETKDGIARLIEPHVASGAGGIVTLALLELGVERHLRISPTEKSARAVLDGVLKKVLDRRAGGHGD